MPLEAHDLSNGKALTVAESKLSPLGASQQIVTHRCVTQFSLRPEPESSAAWSVGCSCQCHLAAWPPKSAALATGWQLASNRKTLDLDRGDAELVQVWGSCAVSEDGKSN
ncbi:hypothetical protein NHJ13734_008730 [Beauveria thailandica]